MNKYAQFLNSLTIQLIREGKLDLAKKVEDSWDEFLELLES